MPEALDVAEERERRLALWADLKVSGEILHSPSALNDRRVFYGGRGIWVHQEATKGICRSANGVTVGLLHTGSSYADDLSDDGVIYHYPSRRSSVPPGGTSQR